MLRLVFVAFVLFIVLPVQSVPGRALQNVLVSYPSKSITSFPILDTARRKGFFQQRGLTVNLVYMRGGLDIKSVVTGDADFGTATTTAITAFLAGAPLRIVCSYNSHVDQVLYSQSKYRTIAQLKGQPIGSVNPGGWVDMLLRRVLLSPEGRLRLEAFQIMIDFGRAAQKIDRPVNANQLIDSALLQDVLREGAAKR